MQGESIDTFTKPFHPPPPPHVCHLSATFSFFCGLNTHLAVGTDPVRAGVYRGAASPSLRVILHGVGLEVRCNHIRYRKTLRTRQELVLETALMFLSNLPFGVVRSVSTQCPQVGGLFWLPSWIYCGSVRTGSSQLKNTCGKKIPKWLPLIQEYKQCGCETEGHCSEHSQQITVMPTTCQAGYVPPALFPGRARSCGWCFSLDCCKKPYFEMVSFHFSKPPTCCIYCECISPCLIGVQAPS